MVIALGVGSFQIGLLAPGGSGAHEDIGRTGIACCVIALVTVDPSRVAALQICSDHDRVARDRHRNTEIVSGLGIGSFQIGLLAPGGVGAHENIGRPGKGGRVISLVAVYPGRIAALAICSDHYRLARDRQRNTELVKTIGIGSLQIGLVAPGGASAHEDIGRPGKGGRVIGLVAIYPDRIAVLSKCSDHYRVARDRHRTTE